MHRTFFSLAITAFLATSALAEPIKIYGKQVTYVRIDGSPAEGGQKAGLRKFKRENAYFGAFYGSEISDGWFYTQGFHGMKIAKAAAKRGCEISTNGPCTLRAVMVPKGVDPTDDTATGLGKQASLTFSGIYQKNRRKGCFGAFAINNAQVHGYSSGWSNMEEARASALAYCEAGVAQRMAPLNIAGRDWARKNGLTTCRIIDAYGPCEQ